MNDTTSAPLTPSESEGNSADETAFVPAPADNPGLTTPLPAPQAAESEIDLAPIAPTATAPTLEDSAEVKDMKLAMIDSAELATRAASLAAKAGDNMHQATQTLLGAFGQQQKLTNIVLASLGSVMLITVFVFAIMAYQLQSRVSQLDTMVLAVGKRVVSMDASLEKVGSSHEMFTAITEKQESMIEGQSKLDAKLEEVLKNAQSAPELAAKQVDVKNQDMTKLVQGLDGRLQAQATSLKLLSSQIQKLQGNLPDTGSLRRELEVLTRQQKERQVAESVKAAAPSPAQVKPRERLVQYPRVSPGDAEKP